MARDEIMEFTYVVSTVVCFHFLILWFGQGPLANFIHENSTCCVEGCRRVFCVHFGLAREKNWGFGLKGFGHGVKINYVSKNSFSNLLIRVGTAPLKYDAGMTSMYGSSPGITNCTLYLCFFG